MRARWLLLLWLLAGVAVWNGFFDILLTRGEKEFFMQRAEFELGRRPEPSLEGIMRQTRHDAAIISTEWALVVTAAGWLTVWAARRGVRD